MWMSVSNFWHGVEERSKGVQGRFKSKTHGLAEALEKCGCRSRDFDMVLRSVPKVWRGVSIKRTWSGGGFGKMWMSVSKLEMVRCKVPTHVDADLDPS